jgi:hypothetical protein
MKSYIKYILRESLLAEAKKTEYEYQLRDIGGADVFYKRKKGEKIWNFIEKEEFEKNSTKGNTVKYKEKEKKETKLPSLSELKVVELTTIEGKNKWHDTKDKLIHMVLDLGEWEKFPSNKIPYFYENLIKYIPSMHEHRCSEGKKGGFFSRLKDGTWLGHIIEHIALELQTLAGHDTGFGRTRGAGKKGEYDVIFNYEEKPVGLLSAREAIKVVKALINGENPNIEEVVKKLKEKKK